ncbi:hypothetical protein SAMN05421767_1582 [Granulicatella balaenopterae]|uniref:Uncharacterized protein n=1 Tax=Granulicatella balaenopterae TaxID=137733 RepID=A0A1H9PG96_9LACT|nr:hypothetical protein [Granulicatella balaenopterae]SER47177.1 hypothetical protein SAMN05421767_1582 [Granulicatella balaenopterae]
MTTEAERLQKLKEQYLKNPHDFLEKVTELENQLKKQEDTIWVTIGEDGITGVIEPLKEWNKTTPYQLDDKDYWVTKNGLVPKNETSAFEYMNTMYQTLDKEDMIS